MQITDSKEPTRSHEAYGVTERLGDGDSTDEAVAELRVNGYTVVPSALPAEFVRNLGVALDRAYAQQVDEIGGEGALDAMHDADIARCMLAYAPELAINALLCIDEFTLDNGATFALPGTHHVAEFPGAAFTNKFERQLRAPAGSFLILDAMLFHRAGVNRTNRVRRAVNHVIGRPFMAQQIDLPSALTRAGVKPPDDPTVRKYLGYRWSPARDVADWRARRTV